MWKARQWHPGDFFQKWNGGTPCRGLGRAVAGPTKREECGCDLLPLSTSQGLIKGVQNKVAYWCRQGADGQSGDCGLHSALRAWAGNWAPVIIIAQTEPPFLAKH